MFRSFELGAILALFFAEYGFIGRSRLLLGGALLIGPIVLLVFLFSDGTPRAQRIWVRSQGRKPFGGSLLLKLTQRLRRPRPQ